jgi:hypothetical protein
MSIDWIFNATDYEEQSFKPIPVGDHRVRISSAEEQTSEKGKQMIKLVLDVSGYTSTIWHYIVFLPDNQKLTNQKLGELWNSFGIPQGNFNLSSWVGKVGAAKVKHEDYKGEPSAKIAYFISKDRQDKLPAWQEPNNAGSSVGAASTDFSPSVDDLPFN